MYIYIYIYMHIYFFLILPSSGSSNFARQPSVETKDCGAPSHGGYQLRHHRDARAKRCLASTKHRGALHLAPLGALHCAPELNPRQTGGASIWARSLPRWRGNYCKGKIDVDYGKGKIAVAAHSSWRARPTAAPRSWTRRLYFLRFQMGLSCISIGYAIYVGFILDVCWISIGSLLGLIGSLLDLYWISLESLLDLCWISIESLLDWSYIYVGYLLDLYWISVGFLLDLYWMYIGSLLDHLLNLYWIYIGFHWISFGSPLDLHQISTGFILALCWISAGYLLNLYWIFVGSLMDLYRISIGSPSDL